MSDVSLPAQPPSGPRRGIRGWRNRLIASRRFQSWASRFPLTRGIARQEGEALFDLVAGFVHSQVLQAIVELRILHILRDHAQTAQQIAARASLPADRAEILLRAAVALGLIKHRRGRYRLARRGAALLGVPGLEAMIAHHDVLYRDLADPAAFFRGETDPELARFWPYVFGADGARDPQIAERYSTLMADSQVLIAEETLRTVSLSGVRHLLDIGGGTGVFLAAAARAYPALSGTLFDLPAVTPGAKDTFADAGCADRITIHPGSFRDDPLPAGADAISLVRVLYDHADETVAALLAAAYAALPPGGRVIISEPMLGCGRPERAGDVYFAIYTAAMGTGKARSAETHARLLANAGFSAVQAPRTHRPFVTSVVTAQKPG